MNEANGTGSEVFSNAINLQAYQEQPDGGTFTLAPGAERHFHQQHQQHFQQQPQQFQQAGFSTAQQPAYALQYNPLQHAAQTYVINPSSNGNAIGPVDQMVPSMQPGPSGLQQQHQASSSQRGNGHAVDPNVRVMDYGTDFPQLPHAETAATPTAGVWASRQPAIKSSEVTEAFKLSANERASRTVGKQFGNAAEEQAKCNQIATETGTKIELCVQKDQSLTILISGKRASVEDAKARLVKVLQTQASIEVDVPKEFHGQIIGRQGERLRQLEKEFLCQIHVPRRIEGKGHISITGPNELIVRAAQRIKELSDEIAKQGNIVLDIPRIFHPWVRGPFNRVLDELTARTQAKINMPPPAFAKNSNIVITGLKEGVEKAAEEIRTIYEARRSTTKSVSCNVNKAQHRYIIGNKRKGIDEILEQTDVAVEVPAEDDDSDQLILRGSQERLGEALAMVYARASSNISLQLKYPEWMRRHLIGPKGSNLHKLVPDHEKLRQLEFEDGGIIYLEGPTESTKAAHAALTEQIARLSLSMCSEEINVPANLHKHLIGRSGAGVNKLKDEHDVQISVPDEKSHSSTIRVEGKKENVKKAIAAIHEIVKRLENEKSRDIIIEHRFHGQVIGKGGENTQRWRKEFPTVTISFPDAMAKSDVVTLRGEKTEVDKLHAVLTKLNKELIALNYQDTVPIFRQYYKHIVGKNGANINKIREDTQTRIELPAKEESQRIVVIGKQANVEKAIAMLNKIQSELENVVAQEVEVANKLHVRLLANGRRLVRDIEDEFGGVHILFPKQSDKSDKVIVRGPKEDVAKAAEALTELAKHCAATTEEVVLDTKPEYIRFLIGREGSNVKKLREKFPSVRIIFPSVGDKETLITLVGRKDEVEQVKQLYEKQINELRETVDISVDVDPKYHRHFISRSAEVLKEIQAQNGNCAISFPKQDSGISRVVIKGSKSCAESAKARIEEIVGDLEAQVTINVEIPHIHHRAIIPHLNELRAKYSAKIKVPERRAEGGQSQGEVDGIPAENLVQITGRDTKCEAAKQALIALIPVTKSITVPLEYHGKLIGTKGEAVMKSHGVRIKIPPTNEKCEEIEVTGRAENMEDALAAIREFIEDNKLRGYKVEMNVPAKYYQKLIGVKGGKIKDIQLRHKVQITIPREEGAPIEITGYEAGCKACEEEIKQMVEELESLQIQELKVDPRFHPRLIGAKGRNLRKLEDQFKVEIKMPGRNDPNPDMVVISGKNQDSVYDCADKISQEEEDFLNDLTERNLYTRHEEKQPEKKQPEVVIRNAPWQYSMDQFPAMEGSNQQAGSTSAPQQPAIGVWGNKRF